MSINIRISTNVSIVRLQVGSCAHENKIRVKAKIKIKM